MKQASDWKPSSTIRVLAYGQSKAGKTFGAGTFPRPCVMDFDRGIATLRGPDFIKKYGFRDFIWEEFYERSFQGSVVSAHNAFDDACRFFDQMMKADNRGKFDSWIVDSLTTLGEDAQNKAVILLGSKAYHEMSQTHKQALQYGLTLPKIQDYGAERSLVEQFVDMVLSSDKNVVMLGHEKEKTNDSGHLTGYAPLLTGKSDESVPLRFDEVYRIRVRRHGDEWLHLCQTQPDGLAKVGSRNGVPDDTPWEYSAIAEAIARNHAFSAAQTAVDTVKSSAA